MKRIRMRGLRTIRLMRRTIKMTHLPQMFQTTIHSKLCSLKIKMVLRRTRTSFTLEMKTLLNSKAQAKKRVHP